jgi:hypothetical protein
MAFFVGESLSASFIFPRFRAFPFSSSSVSRIEGGYCKRRLFQSSSSSSSSLPCRVKSLYVGSRLCEQSWEDYRKYRVFSRVDKSLEDFIDVEAKEIVDEEWQRKRREESEELERRRQQEKEEELEKEGKYAEIGSQLKGYPQEEVRKAKQLVSSFIRAGEEIEEVIAEAAEKGELTPLVLLVIWNRLELARHDDERDAIQALDLLYRRVELEIHQAEASQAMQLLHELLNLHDGFSHEEWLHRASRTMLKVFVPEDAFTILGPSGIDLENHHGRIAIPEEDDDILLRVDFIREVDQLLEGLENQAEIKPVAGLDAQSVAVRLRQQEKLRTIQQVKDLRRVAATLKWS